MLRNYRSLMFTYSHFLFWIVFRIITAIFSYDLLILIFPKFLILQSFKSSKVFHSSEIPTTLKFPIPPKFSFMFLQSSLLSKILIFPKFPFLRKFPIFPKFPSLWSSHSCADIFAPVICHLANLSFREGVFPDRFKKAQVTPLIKKAGLDPEIPANYRPISNLVTISKVLERLLLSRLQRSHLAMFKFHSSFNRPTDSTTALRLPCSKYWTMSTPLQTVNALHALWRSTFLQHSTP